MVRSNLEFALPSLLVITIACGAISVYQKYTEVRPTKALLSCALKDGSTIAADSFVISSNAVNLSVDGSLLLIPFSEVRYCYQALVK